MPPRRLGLALTFEMMVIMVFSEWAGFGSTGSA